MALLSAWIFKGGIGGGFCTPLALALVTLLGTGVAGLSNS